MLLKRNIMKVASEKKQITPSDTAYQKTLTVEVSGSNLQKYEIYFCFPRRKITDTYFFFHG